ncbi:hypothetical protein ACFQQB_12095 [Nonomuraea rubra]|uniref:hypothetical protein n=1 Tax=Nonomuraea rubra TaxID=46180 RepID=UPI003621E92A
MWGTLLLPFAGDGAIDWGRLGAQIDGLAASGVDGSTRTGPQASSMPSKRTSSTRSTRC